MVRNTALPTPWLRQRETHMDPALPAPLTHRHCGGSNGVSLKALHQWEFATAEVEKAHSTHFPLPPCLPHERSCFSQEWKRKEPARGRNSREAHELATVESSVPNELLTWCFQALLASTSFFNENSITAFRTCLATRENEASLIINSSGGHMAPRITANSPLRRSRRRHWEALRTSPQGQSALRSNTAGCHRSPPFPRAGVFLKPLQLEEDTTRKTASSPRSGYTAMLMLLVPGLGFVQLCNVCLVAVLRDTRGMCVLEGTLAGRPLGILVWEHSLSRPVSPSRIPRMSESWSGHSNRLALWSVLSTQMWSRRQTRPLHLAHWYQHLARRWPPACLVLSRLLSFLIYNSFITIEFACCTSHPCRVCHSVFRGTRVLVCRHHSPC